MLRAIHISPYTVSPFNTFAVLYIIQFIMSTNRPWCSIRYTSCDIYLIKINMKW